MALQTTGHLDKDPNLPRSAAVRDAQVLLLAQRALKMAEFSGSDEIALGKQEFAALLRLAVKPSERVMFRNFWIVLGCLWVFELARAGLVIWATFKP